MRYLFGCCLMSCLNHGVVSRTWSWEGEKLQHLLFNAVSCLIGGEKAMTIPVRNML